MRSLPLGALVLVGFALAAFACDGVGPDTRAVEVRGLPSCPPKSFYARPLVVRFDRDRAVFEESFTTQTRVDSPSIPTLTVPRKAMRATIRVGVCSRTSVATWDCSAATWLTSTTVTLDRRMPPVVVTLPATSVACTPVAP